MGIKAHVVIRVSSPADVRAATRCGDRCENLLRLVYSARTAFLLSLFVVILVAKNCRRRHFRRCFRRVGSSLTLVRQIPSPLLPSFSLPFPFRPFLLLFPLSLDLPLLPTFP